MNSTEGVLSVLGDIVETHFETSDKNAWINKTLALFKTQARGYTTCGELTRTSTGKSKTCRCSLKVLNS